MAETEILDGLKAVPEYAQAIVGDIAAVRSVINAIGDAIPDESRSIIVEVVNGTSRTLTKTAAGFDSGGFGTPLPDIQIHPFSSNIFTAQNTSVLQGVIGNVFYQANGQKGFNVHFSNPFFGGNTQSVQSQVDDILSILGDISSGNHAHARFVVLDRNGPFPNIQKDWRSCPKCQGMHFAGFPEKGVCPAGGQHDQANSFAYDMVFNSPPSEHVQTDWKACRKCQGLFFGPFKGVCPAGGQHDDGGSFNYGVRFDVPVSGRSQNGWRSCKKCQGLYFGPFHGRCPAGGTHDDGGSFNYVVFGGPS